MLELFLKKKQPENNVWIFCAFINLSNFRASFTH